MYSKTICVGFGGLVLLMLGTGDAFGFTCPVLIKAANESIAKAESKVAGITGDREKGRAMAMIELAKDLTKQAAADHKEAVDKKSAEAHYRGEAKAKAAQALIDQVK